MILSLFLIDLLLVQLLKIILLSIQLTPIGIKQTIFSSLGYTILLVEICCLMSLFSQLLLINEDHFLKFFTPFVLK